MRFLLLLLLLLPIAELMLLVEVGGEIGAIPTLLLVLAIAAIGLRVIRYQSTRNLRSAQQRMQGGEMPGREILEGFMISIAGGLLLVPGFITDAVALCLLVPPLRRALVGWLFRRGGMAAMHAGPGAFVFTRFGNSPFSTGWPPQAGPGRRDIYEGEFSREDEPKTPLEGPKGPYEP
jgi:UPF0716 protein FxsA